MGPTRHSLMPGNPLMQVRVPPDVAKQVDDSGMTRSEFLRAAITEKLAGRALTATVKVAPAAVKKVAKAKPKKARATRKTADASIGKRIQGVAERCPHRHASVCDACAKEREKANAKG